MPHSFWCVSWATLVLEEDHAFEIQLGAGQSGSVGDASDQFPYKFLQECEVMDHGISWHLQCDPHLQLGKKLINSLSSPLDSSGNCLRLQSAIQVQNWILEAATVNEQKRSGYHFAIEFLLSLLSTTSPP